MALPSLPAMSRLRSHLRRAPVQPVVTPTGSRALIWNLESGGWSEREAGNLVALLHGLRPAETGWSEHEIDHLRFLRNLVTSGRLES